MRPSPGIVFDFPAVDVMMLMMRFSIVGILQITLSIQFSQNQEDACMKTVEKMQEIGVVIKPKLTVLIVFCI